MPVGNCRLWTGMGMLIVYILVTAREKGREMCSEQAPCSISSVLSLSLQVCFSPSLLSGDDLFSF